jgi:type II secretory pathway component PulJ
MPLVEFAYALKRNGWMVYHYVKSQQGSTLIELMVGITLGSMVILCVFHLMSMELSLAKNIDHITQVGRKLNEVHQLIYTELRRAGHQINQSSASHFSDVETVVYVGQSGDRIGVVYQVAESGDEAFRHIMFLYDESNHNLKVCDKYAPSTLTSEQASQSTRASSCFTLFDRNSFKVERFYGQHLSLTGSTAKSGMIDVELALSSVMDPDVTERVTFQVTQRSWR